MIEVLPRYGTHFILLRKVHNRPGIAASIMESLKEAKIDIESFQAVAHPDSQYADILVLGVEADKAVSAIESIRKANERIGSSPPIIVENLVGIVIRGITIANSTEVLHRAFKVCSHLGINIAMAYTTRITLNIYINAKDYSDKIVEELRKEFESSM